MSDCTMLGPDLPLLLLSVITASAISYSSAFLSSRHFVTSSIDSRGSIAPGRRDAGQDVCSVSGSSSLLVCYTTGTGKTSDALVEAIRQMDLSLSDDATRIFHGRGGYYPGYEHVTLDWYPPVLLLTSFKAVDSDKLALWCDALSTRWAECFEHDNKQEEEDQGTSMNLVYQCRADTPTTTRLVFGSVPDTHVVTENDGKDKFLVHLLRGQNHGLFLDMANGRTWVRENAANETILNLFAYTCAFSISALNGEAREVINVDMSKGALKVGQRNHEINRLLGESSSSEGVFPGRSRFLGHDIFKTWGKIRKLGPYGIVIVDPPSYQLGSFVAKKDYRKLIRRLPALLTPGGRALICLNAPELDTAYLTGLVQSSAPMLRFVQRLDNPETFPAIDKERALKVLVYQMLEEEEGDKEDNR